MVNFILPNPFCFSCVVSILSTSEGIITKSESLLLNSTIFFIIVSNFSNFTLRFISRSSFVTKGPESVEENANFSPLLSISIFTDALDFFLLLPLSSLKKANDSVLMVLGLGALILAILFLLISSMIESPFHFLFRMTKFSFFSVWATTPSSDLYTAASKACSFNFNDFFIHQACMPIMPISIRLNKTIIAGIALFFIVQGQIYTTW